MPESVKKRTNKQQYLDRMKQMIHEQEQLALKFKKFSKAKTTYDHHGEQMVVKGFNKNGQYDFWTKLDKIENTINQAEQPEVEDMGIIDSHLMLSLQKVKYKNDNILLEDYISMDEAKRKMNQSEHQRLEEWMSKYPETVDVEPDVRLQDNFKVPAGVNLKDQRGINLLRGKKYHESVNLMTLQQYYKSIETKNLIDRRQDMQFTTKSDLDQKPVVNKFMADAEKSDKSQKSIK